ncbi:MAG: SDR family NAD(P)-dependent oxidoreductase [Jatrophihabitans sp.]|uniref:SDR family NAD(P)-dependent oxidoreductase n=1 Tax=Jatrophihabitans sp. TaxID=1932789 RepID=UPI003F81999E
MTRRSRAANAVVTGAGSGIGRAFALELAARDSQVVCSDIDLASAQRTADDIAVRGGKAVAVHTDVRDAEQVAELADTARQWFGGPATLVVNNAGVGQGGRLVGETPLDDWRWTIDVNLWGVIHGCHVFTPQLREAGRGGIINVASAASFAAAPRMAAYNVSKAGVLALTETLAAELAGSGVHVTALCPTFVRTNILAGGRIESRSNELAATVMRLVGMSPERVARTTLDAHDRGAQYVLPQLDAKALWSLKRHLPRVFGRTTALLERVAPLGG